MSRTTFATSDEEASCSTCQQLRSEEHKHELERAATKRHSGRALVRHLEQLYGVNAAAELKGERVWVVAGSVDFALTSLEKVADSFENDL